MNNTKNNFSTLSESELLKGGDIFKLVIDHISMKKK
uniref:Signaling peptide SilCR n=1 Tax=Streptococcus sp. group G TaxID=1320 RepID=C6KGW3_STRSG|nr:signaling peptide SilCR [Streptococcus sp. 'group G']